MPKYNYVVDYEYLTYKSEKIKCNSIMTTLPLNKSTINFEDNYIRESCIKLLNDMTQNCFYFVNFFHLDILTTQKILIKINSLYEGGSLRDMIYKSNPLEEFSKKYNHKGRGLPMSLIKTYGTSILKALNYLHTNSWYHLHLHTGNIFVDGENVRIAEIENVLSGLPIRNEHFLNFIYECYNNEYYLKQLNSNVNSENSAILSKIYKNKANVFEKIDIVAFGRIVYEMCTGNELKSPCPDEIEYKYFDPHVNEVLKAIFVRSKLMDGKINLNLPDVSAQDLLGFKLFENEGIDNKDGKLNFITLLLGDNVSLLSGLNNNSICEFDKYFNIKEIVFNQKAFLKEKLRDVNNYKK